MRTSTNKCGLLAAAAVLLLLTAMLVTGCSDSITVEKPYTPPEGMGAVILNFNKTIASFNKTIARSTILPDDADANIGIFEAFTITFTPSGVGGVLKAVTVASADKDDPINLVAGNYNLEVIAYLDENDLANTAAAVWSSEPGSPIDISTGGVQTVPVTLKPYDPIVGTENGTFAWNITNSITSTLETGSKMTLTDLTGSTAGGGWSDVDLDTPTNASNFTNTTGVAIPAGYYYLDITLKSSTQTRVFRHVVHIYQNLKSTFGITFTNDYIAVRIIFTPDISYSNPEDDPPVLSVDNVDGDKVYGKGTISDPYLLTKGSSSSVPSEIEIEIDNESSFDSFDVSIDGVVDATIIVSTGVFTLGTSITPLDVKDVHQIAVTGIKDDGDAYIVVFYVQVID